jgi:phenylacetic acid degradation protein PaaD
MTPRKAAEAMYAQDRAARALGIVIDDVGDGTARGTMTVRPDMLNGHGICHGGLTFTLADTVFAYACNSSGRATVALSADIAFTAPAKEGERLTATARERTRQGRTGIYDVEVTAEGRLVALFRGTSYELKNGTAR